MSCTKEISHKERSLEISELSELLLLILMPAVVVGSTTGVLWPEMRRQLNESDISDMLFEG